MYTNGIRTLQLSIGIHGNASDLSLNVRHSIAKTTKSAYIIIAVKRRKAPLPRQMLCTDIQIEAGKPEQAFIVAWNRLVDEQEWEQTIDCDDVLKCYRAKELIRLVEKTGHIDMLPYELMLKTLDYIEIGIDGKVDVIFLAGTRIEFD